MIHRQGPKPQKLEITEVRSLQRDELGLLRDRQQKTFIQRIRDPHHALARNLALGKKGKEAAELAGFTAARCYALQQDPTFQELVEYYRKLVNESYKEEADAYMSLLNSNAMKAERQIAEKLEEAEENNTTLPTRELIAISRDAADRTGYGKKQTNVNVNVDFAAQLERAVQRSNNARVIELPAARLPSAAAGRAGEASGDVSPAPIRRRA